VGPTAVLVNPASATPAFTAPGGLTQNTTLSFQLIVNDGALASAPDLVNVTVLPTRPTIIRPRPMPARINLFLPTHR